MEKTIEEIVKELLDLDVNAFTEKKNGLTYLSWAYAVREILKVCPDFSYKVWRDSEGKPYVYDELTGYMVFTEMTIGGVTREMWLPVMDNNNKAMKSMPYTFKTKYGDKQVEAATMFDVNKTIMRCLVKNFSVFGLGNYIYAGDDLPEEALKQEEEKLAKEVEKTSAKRIEVKKKTFAEMSGKTVEDVEKALADKNVAAKDVEKTLDTWIKLKNGGAPVEFTRS